MRLVVVLLLSGALLYLGGLYRVEAFSVAAVALWAVVPALSVMALPVRRKLYMSVSLPKSSLHRHTPFTCVVEIENRSFLSLGRFTAVVECGMQGEAVLRRRLAGSAAGRETVKIELPLTAAHCGQLTVRLHNIRVYDLLAIVSFKKKLEAEAQAVLLPELLEMPVALEWAALLPAEEDGAPGAENGPPPEVREIDAYRPGDAMRDVHWKLSARQDTWLTKRYSMETRPRFCIWWDGGGWEKAEMERTDAFWALCFALSSGLLAAEAAHNLCWYDTAAGQVRTQRVENRGELLHILTERLRTADILTPGELPESVLRARFAQEAAGETVLVLDTALRLSLGQGAIVQFHGDRYAEEIGKNQITI